MDDLRREVAGLHARLRLLSLALTGIVAIFGMAAGGADVVASALVAPGWKVSTRNLAGSATLDRLSVSSDEDVATVQVQNANLVLASQTATPPTTTGGALWYDSTTPTSGKLKFYNGTAWTEPGLGGLLRAPQVLTSGTSYTPPAGCTALLVIVVGGGGGGSKAASAGGGGGGGGGGSTVYRYFTSPGACTYSIGGGGAGGAANNGSPGVSSTFTCGGVTVTAPGGSGGVQGFWYSGGGNGGGAGTNGTFTIPGQPGQCSAADAQFSYFSSGTGGSTPFGSGGAGTVFNNTGGNGAGFGGGGGGGGQSSSGGNGAPGGILIYEYR